MTDNPHLTRRWPFGRVTEGLPTTHPELKIRIVSGLEECVGPLLYK